MKTEVVTYEELARRVGGIFMMNKIPEIDTNIYENIVNGRFWIDEEEDEEELQDIYQWYLITPSGAEYLKDVSNELVFYSDLLDEYVWGITHLGTAWDYVETEIKA